MLARPITWLALLVLAAVLIGYGFYWWMTGRFIESTDDAYLRADSVTASPKVSGYVAAVLVGDNERVAAGQPLVRIDPENYRAVLARQAAQRDARRADVAVAEAQLQQQGAAVEQAAARVAGDEVDARYAIGEATRYRGLVASGAETAERLAEMVNRRDRAAATLRADKAALQASQRQAETLQAQIGQAHAQVEAGETSIHEAAIDVGNTEIRASIAGRIGDRTVRVGQYVQPGTRLLTIVPVQDIYVVANFKETQLAGMRVGERATVSIDALGGHALPAVIDSFAPGTGSEFALLPPENATGNFTKIVQRVPVKLRLQLDEQTRQRLVPGLSATVTINNKTHS